MPIREFLSARARSIASLVHPESQLKLAKQTLTTLPLVTTAITAVLKAAPYVIGAFVIIALIDIRLRLIGDVPDYSAAWSGVIAFCLIIAANGLCYVEAYNTHTTGERIPNAGRYVTRRFFRLVAVIGLSTLMTFVGLLMLIIPGVYLALRLAVAPAACIIDDKGVRDSMKTSMRATKGQAPLIITVFGLVGMVSLAFIASFAFLSGVAWHVMLVIVFGLLPPLIQVTIAILYLNGHPDTELDFS